MVWSFQFRGPFLVCLILLYISSHFRFFFPCIASPTLTYYTCVLLTPSCFYLVLLLMFFVFCCLNVSSYRLVSLFMD